MKFNEKGRLDQRFKGAKETQNAIDAFSLLPAGCQAWIFLFIVIYFISFLIIAGLFSTGGDNVEFVIPTAVLSAVLSTLILNWKKIFDNDTKNE